MTSPRCIITDISWERVFLKIKVLNETGEDLFFEFNEKSLKLDCIPIGNDEYEIILNMTAVMDGSFLDNGSWRFGYYGNGIIIEPKTGERRYGYTLVPCEVSDEVAYKIESLDKIFRYSNNTSAYTVSFEIYTLDDVKMHVYINSRFMTENRKWKKRSSVRESKGFVSFLKKFRLNTVKKTINLYYQIMTRIIPKKKNKILIMSETKNILWGNLKAIHERIYELGLDKKYKIDTNFRVSVGNNNSILEWIKVTTKIAKSDYIFVDDYVPIFGFLKLDKRVKLVQAWHAGAGFKAVGYCRFGKKGSPHPTESCHKKYNVALAPSKSTIPVFEEVFGVKKEYIYPTGMPRLDGYMNDNKISSFKKEFYDKYPKLKDKKIILFAPTYRGVGQKTAYYDYSKVDFKRLYDFCKDEYVILVKMHPFIKEHPNISEYSDRIMDFSEYPFINDLYYVTDILITDYSSAYYEFSLFKKPIIFFTYDRVLYEITRGVYQYIKDSAPGKVVDSFDELMQALENKDYDLEKTVKFADESFDEHKGYAADRLLDIVLNDRV